MTVIGFIFVALASCIAIGDVIGGYQAILRRRKGIPRGFSTVPLLSLLFSLAALALLYQTIGYWALLPAALDPATWSLVYLPFYLLWRVINGKSL